MSNSSPSTTEFWTSENKYDNADILVKRCLYDIHTGIFFLFATEAILVFVVFFLLFGLFCASVTFLKKTKYVVQERRVNLSKSKKKERKLMATPEQNRQRLREEAAKRAKGDLIAIWKFQQEMDKHKAAAAGPRARNRKGNRMSDY